MGKGEQGASLTEGRWLTIPRTLSFILNGDAILLMKRSPHKRIFPNRYNGVGGHIERDEDVMTSARREIFEETGLTIRDLRLRAVYNVDAGDTSGIVLFVFVGWSESQTITANEEGSLHWMPRGILNSVDLVEDLPILLPRILNMPDHAPPLYIHVSYDAHDAIQMLIYENE